VIKYRQVKFSRAGSADQNLITQIEALVDGLDNLLLKAGFDPETSLPMA
jgi:hypothetical protein